MQEKRLFKIRHTHLIHIPSDYKCSRMGPLMIGLSQRMLNSIPCVHKDLVWQWFMPRLVRPRKHHTASVWCAFCFSAGVFCAVVSHPADTIVSKLNQQKGSSFIQVGKNLGLLGNCAAQMQIVCFWLVAQSVYAGYEIDQLSQRFPFKTYWGLQGAGRFTGSIGHITGA